MASRRMTGASRGQALSLAARALVLGLACCALGCKPQDSPPQPDPPAPTAPLPSSDAPPHAPSRGTDIDRLRALGYVGYSDQKADPGRSGVVHLDPDLSCPGYNLYSNRNQSSAVLMDAAGGVIRTWNDAQAKHWSHCELLPDGDLLVISMVPSKGRKKKDPRFEPRYLLRLSWTGQVIWKRFLAAHHDVEVTPRDQLMTLVYKLRRVPEINADIDVRDDQLTLLSHDGQVLETYSVYDLLASHPDSFTFQNVAPGEKYGRWKIDLLHTNSLEWMPHPRLAAEDPLYAEGNILICMRHQDALAIINWDRKELLWTWGPGEISGPHDARLLANGHILLFDNGLSRGWSRVIELDPLSKRIVWEYHAPEPEDFYTISRGSNQRLPNGNTLIGNSDNSQAFEVTPAGRIVWEFLNPMVSPDRFRASFERMTRYPPEFIQHILEQFETPDA